MADRKICYLHDLDDYKVASDYPDVRGWDLVDREGHKVGEVDNLLVNKDAQRVVYLDVDADDYIKENGGRTGNASLPGQSGERMRTTVNDDGEDHLIVPIGMVRIDDDNNQVLCDAIGADTFRKVRRHRKDENLTPDYELEVMNVYTNNNGEVVAVDDTFYSRPEFQSRDRR